MPAGPDFTSVQSYFVVAAIKYAGYSASTLYLNHRYPDRTANPFLFGAFRTGLGILLGIAVGVLGFHYLEVALVLFLLGLLPVRVFEWYIAIRTFYKRSDNYPSSLMSDIPFGIAFSFLLDVPVIFGFLVTGGLWLC